ncbi:hypothetical protein H8R25_07210 [Flavobacterium sp. F-392]|uniref:Uncharacterized protein n=1 Tax=Flavobacterium muglaense TaxID=2764716 RepID=A0A923MZ62_9FLAO|nr:hypothetical protein [Flavobacterium muglaense]MBC5844222.1 hypothetical protein [Flavobacterium muglaense]
MYLRTNHSVERKIAIKTNNQYQSINAVRITLFF